MRKGLEALKEAERLKSKALAAEKSTAISSDDPEALIKLRAKLDDMETRHDGMKRVNREYRKGSRGKDSPEAIRAGVNAISGISDSTRDALAKSIEEAYSWNKRPFPDYSIKNSNANIKRVKARIAELEARANRQQSQDVSGDGWKIYEDREENRLVVDFSGRRLTREAFKSIRSFGFLWSRSRQEFVRKISNAAACRAQHLAVWLRAHESTIYEGRA